MTTFGELFDTIRPRIRGYTVDDLDAPPLVEIKVDLTAEDGTVELPVGDKGPDGDPGEPAPAIIFKGYVTDDEELPDASILGPYDEGKAWANTTTDVLWLWTGDDWMEIPDALGAPGPVGPPGTIGLGTLTTSPAGGAAELEAVGSPLARTLNVTLPRGLKGPIGDVGPSGPIRAASDYSDAVAPQAGDVPEWDAAIGKYKPTTRKRMIGPFTLIDSDFSKTSFTPPTTVGPTSLIASLSIPAQTTKYRLWITGMLALNSSTTLAMYGLVMPVSTMTAAARGQRDYGTGVRSCAILPYSGSKLTPGSASGEMPSGVAQTLNVYIGTDFGGVTCNVVSDPGNNLQVWLIPV